MKRYNCDTSPGGDWYSACGIMVEDPQGEYVLYEDVPGWIPVDTKSEPDHQPIRQIVMIEGTRFHAGEHWTRRYTGEAYTHKYGPLGLREKDFYRLCEDGDIDPGTAKIIYWIPYRDILPNPPEKDDA